MTSGWPNPERPGVPANSERDGWHWLLFKDGKAAIAHGRLELFSHRWQPPVLATPPPARGGRFHLSWGTDTRRRAHTRGAIARNPSTPQPLGADRPQPGRSFLDGAQSLAGS